MWKMKTKTKPVTLGPPAMIKKGRQIYLNENPENFSLAEIQKLVLNSTFLEEPFHFKRNNYIYNTYIYIYIYICLYIC